jgi:hypothetical protein
MLLTHSLRRRIGRVLWWIGLPATAGGIVGFALKAQLPGGIALGTGLALIGLNILLNGELIVGPEPRPFSARGSAVRGRLEARTGLCDLRVATCGPERIAGIVYGPFGKPGFEVVDGVAELQLRPTFPPAITRWQSDLAGNVLWDARIRSFLGDLVLDLNQLRFETLSAQTTLGRLSIALPRRGYARMSVNSSLGEIEVFIPAETGVKIAVRRGALATIHVTDPRLVEVSPGQYVTPDFDTTQGQVELAIRTWSGDVTLAPM